MDILRAIGKTFARVRAPGSHFDQVISEAIFSGFACEYDDESLWLVENETGFRFCADYSHHTASLNAAETWMTERIAVRKVSRKTAAPYYRPEGLK